MVLRYIAAPSKDVTVLFDPTQAILCVRLRVVLQSNPVLVAGRIDVVQYEFVVDLSGTVGLIPVGRLGDLHVAHVRHQLFHGSGDISLDVLQVVDVQHQTDVRGVDLLDDTNG